MSKKVLAAPMEEIAPIICGAVQAGQDVTLTVTGNSMRPLWYHLQNTVTLTGCDPDQLKKGDVPLYRRTNGKYVLHRIVRVHEKTLDLAGDGQSYIETGIEKNQVLAVVKRFTRRERVYTVQHIGYRLYSWLWLWLLPIRKYLFALYSKLKRVF